MRASMAIEGYTVSEKVARAAAQEVFTQGWEEKIRAIAKLPYLEFRAALDALNNQRSPAVGSKVAVMHP